MIDCLPGRFRLAGSEGDVQSRHIMEQHSENMYNTSLISIQDDSTLFNQWMIIMNRMNIVCLTS